MVRGDSGWPVLFNTHWMIGAVQRSGCCVSEVATAHAAARRVGQLVCG